MRRMRTPISMLRRLSAGILVVVFLLAAALPTTAADTGTYGISDYKITLEPQSSGQVRITVEQEWRVLSGHIPWVTVGLPHSNFTIEGSTGAAAKVSADNGGGFTGVRIDLDKDYQPGETFKIGFTVLQNNLLERLTEDKKWRIDFIPGWYDRATIEHLRIDLVSPVSYDTYSSVSPMPTSVNGNTVTWEKSNLSPGSRFNSLTVESLDGSFLAESVPVGTSRSNKLGTTFWIIVAVIVVVGILIFLGVRSYKKAQDVEMKKRVVTIEKEMALDKEKKEKIEAGFQEYVEKKEIKPDAEGRYYDRSYGSYVTPAIWAAIIASQHSHQTTTTGTSKPGCVSCACVSCACACACACAGGGAAGCSRKTLHECGACSNTGHGVTAESQRTPGEKHANDST